MNKNSLPKTDTTLFKSDFPKSLNLYSLSIPLLLMLIGASAVGAVAVGTKTSPYVLPSVLGTQSDSRTNLLAKMEGREDTEDENDREDSSESDSMMNRGSNSYSNKMRDSEDKSSQERLMYKDEVKVKTKTQEREQEQDRERMMGDDEESTDTLSDDLKEAPGLMKEGLKNAFKHSLKLTVDNATGITYVETKRGTVEVNITPETIIEKASLFNPSLRIGDVEVETNDDGQTTYVVSGTRIANLFGLLKLTVPVRETFSAQTGQLLGENNAFWVRALNFFSSSN